MKYPIFHIDLNTANFQEKDSLYTVLNDYLTAWEDKYGPVSLKPHFPFVSRV